MISIEELILQAMQEGKFKDLPGKGKPLKLEENPLEDEQWRLAYHLLRNSGYTLPWIAMRQEIEDELAAVRAALRDAWQWREESLATHQPPDLVDGEWRRAEAAFREQLERIGKKILDYNLQAPSAKFHLMPLNAERELRALREEL